MNTKDDELAALHAENDALKSENERIRKLLRIALGATTDILGDLSRIATIRDAILDEVGGRFETQERITQRDLRAISDQAIDEPSVSDEKEAMVR
jgi:hypothetical protein